MKGMEAYVTKNGIVTLRESIWGYYKVSLHLRNDKGTIPVLPTVATRHITFKGAITAYAYWSRSLDRERKPE